MNDENRNTGRDDTAAEMLNSLQDQVDQLNAELDERDKEIEVLEAEKDVLADQVLELSQREVAPAGDDELRALAATYRQALRNGHPDAPKHLDDLLGKLGA